MSPESVEKALTEALAECWKTNAHSNPEPIGLVHLWRGNCGEYQIPVEMLDEMVWQPGGLPDTSCDAYHRLEAWGEEQDRRWKAGA